MEITLRQENEKMLLALIRSGRLPHTLIIEADSKEERDSAALLIAAGAVCTEKEKPCLVCNQCRKVFENNHPDVVIVKPSKTSKTGIASLKDWRNDYLPQIYTKANEAPVRVFVFPSADKLLQDLFQNAVLKVIEEPPQNLLFIFTAEKAKALLPTVRSRARIITLSRTETTDEESEAIAEAITDGIVDLYEYDLLATLSRLGKKEEIETALTAFCEKLRQALAFQSGVMTDDPCAIKLSRKLDRARLIALTETTLAAVTKLKTNVNPQLLTTWLCTQYRRITWQK